MKLLSQELTERSQHKALSNPATKDKMAVLGHLFTQGVQQEVSMQKKIFAFTSITGIR